MSWDSLTYPAPRWTRKKTAARRFALARPELPALLGLGALLNFWNLSINGWANTYYAAAVRSMSTSWHDFLYASLDKSGLMTVDKPPLSLWIQALSVRIFGFHPLSVLVPQALMGIAAVGLLYDLTRRRFGRAAGFVAGLVLATTPVVVAVSRHNNPDELLVLCCVAALWCAVRALETGRTRWFVLTGICIGFGFETKMAVALMVVPGIAAAWLWVAPSRLRAARHPASPDRPARESSSCRIKALKQSLAGLAALVVVGGAWPLLVMLTPAADRPWISGTSDNSILSLIFGYNGLGRIAGQTGGPGGTGGGGTMFGGPTGPFRLLQTGLGDQAGWLLGFAIVSGLALVAVTRLRRRDDRTGWLLVIGGAFATPAVAFSFASGIFHPYYVSLLAPFIAALIGAGFSVIRSHRSRILAPLAIGAGIVTELVVLNELNGALSWASPVLIIVAGGCAALLATKRSARVRTALLGVALTALLAAPATWAAETLGHATNGTFPTGGPASAAHMGAGPPGGSGRFGGGALRGGALPGGPPPGGVTGGSAPSAGGGTPGGFAGNSTSLSAAIRYAEAHGGGTIGVESQSSAAAAIVSQDGDVAGLGGFSGRESSVSVSWLANEVKTGHVRWVVADTGGQGFGIPGDTRTGSKSAINAVQKACTAVTVSTGSGTNVTLYDCAGKASAILKAA